LKSGEAERCRGSNPRLSAIDIATIRRLLIKWSFFILGKICAAFVPLFILLL